VPTKKPKIKDVYDSIATQFSASRNYIWPDLENFLKNIKPNSSVLDVGCGNGRLLIGLPKKIKYTGLDISSELLKEAEKKYPNHQFIETDITNPSIWKHLPKFDYIFCVAVIHHLSTTKDHLFLLDQIQKHLKPNGKVLLTAWNLWQSKYLHKHFDLQTKLINPFHLYVPFQNQLRFHFAFSKIYFQYLLWKLKLPWKIQKSPRNYLISTK
jgi:2-polyprenyl-3-methyl-5-hydroxy-6-metoxy-1,4-benzoquinol methylase